jgi:formate C-acetyltransferase
MASDVLDTPKAKAGRPSPPPFVDGLWTREIDVRDFIQQNVTPYHGDEAFLAGPTERTKGIWEILTRLFAEERKTSVLDISQIPSSITAHAPG